MIKKLWKKYLPWLIEVYNKDSDRDYLYLQRTPTMQLGVLSVMGTINLP